MKNFLGVQKFVLMRGGGIVSPAMMLVVFSDTVQAKLQLHGVRALYADINYTPSVYLLIQ